MNKYDATNYIKHPSLIVDGNDANFIALNSSLLLIKWHVLSPTRDRKLRYEGKVTIETHTPLGNLPETKQTLIQSMDSNLIQFLNVPLVDNLPYDLTFTNGQLVTKSQLTIWEFIPYLAVNINYVNYMPSNNPSSVDPAVLTAAFTAAAPAMAAQIGAATQVATTAALAAQASAETARNSIDRDVAIKGWTGTPADHLVVTASTNRLETKIFNRHNQRMYISVGTPVVPGAPVVPKTFESYTEILEPNGSYISTDDDRLLPIYVYLAAGKPNGQASITELTP
jgi:hypothetical protein